MYFLFFVSLFICRSAGGTSRCSFFKVLFVFFIYLFLLCYLGKALQAGIEGFIVVIVF